MENQKALISVFQSLQIEKYAANSTEEQFQILTEFIDKLIQNDFNRLLSILYRVDISEEKLKRTLSLNKDKQISSASLIAKLLIEREAEKIISRAKYRNT